MKKQEICNMIANYDKSSNKMKNGKKVSNSAGITLSALVVTIIVMLILAGVTLHFINDAGILKTSENAAKNYESADEEDTLSVAFATVFSKSTLKDEPITAEALQAELDKTGRETVVTWDVDDEGILNVRFKKTNNEHSVDIETGKIVYEATYSKNTEEDLPKANIRMTASTTEWINQDITVTIEKDKEIDVSKFDLEYKTTIEIDDGIEIKDGKKVEKWVKCANDKTILTVTQNTKIEARYRYYNSVNTYESLEIKNIDKLAPKDFMSSITTTTNSITVMANASDASATKQNACSGIASYRFSKDGGSNWTNWQTSGTHVFDKLTQTTQYNIQVETKDKAGNTTKSSTTQNTTNTVTGLTITVADADKWTNQSKTVTITAADNNYQTIRYTTDGTVPMPTTGTAITSGGTFTVEQNCTIYAIAYDSDNQAGATASAIVMKIDKNPPTYTGVRIENVTYAGYDVYIDGVNDNGGSGVKHILFMTWSPR